MPSVSKAFKNVVTTGVSAASREFDVPFASCFEGECQDSRSGDCLSTAHVACESPSELTPDASKVWSSWNLL